MAEPLKNHFGPDIPREIASRIQASDPRFKAEAFLSDVLDGYEPLALMPRGWKIARALKTHLPPHYPEALRILLAALDPSPRYKPSSTAMASFIYLPHVFFIAEYGLDHFEESMEAQRLLTQRFTAEFSIRPYLERHPEATLARLNRWAKDANVHVRRLVSEGSRPRLPWAPRLRAFQKNPRPVLKLLELLKDDPELYVRRSVANNLNDIGKDHPELLVQTLRRWDKGATPERRWIIRHALRFLVKKGHREALALLGVGAKPRVRVSAVQFSSRDLRIGEKLTLTFDVKSLSPRSQTLQIDFRVHFVKGNGKSAPKVFKLRRLDLPARARETMKASVSFKPLTTRKPYPGLHRLEALINGVPFKLGTIDLRK